MKPATDPNSNAATRPRSRQKTKDAIELAILRLERQGKSLSIAAVAREAGVTAALIHNTYPDIAEQIRQLMGKGVRKQRDDTREALKKEREASSQLRAENRALKADVDRLASINQKLLSELGLLRGVAAGKVVPLLRPASV